jgi:hypothetical protein
MERRWLALFGIILFACGQQPQSALLSDSNRDEPSPAIAGAQNRSEERTPVGVGGAGPTPRHAPDIDNEDGLGGLSVLELIDQLTEISEEGVGFHSTAWASGFIAEDNDAGFGGGVLGSKKPVVAPPMRELVRRGVGALPELIKHLSDARKTKLTCRGMMWMSYGTEYDPRRRGETFADDDVSSRNVPIGGGPYDVCVGDLCYVAVGQIVNRHLSALRYQPTGGMVVNSPVVSPSIAQAVKRDWAALTEAQHRESLIADALNTTPYTDWGAWRRLRFYYPGTTAEDVALKLLKRPLYNHEKLWNFLWDVLVKEPHERRWSTIIDDYIVENGAASGEILPFWLYWIFFDTDFERTPEFVTDGQTAQRILAKLYPQFDRRKPTFFNAASLDDQATALNAINGFPSEEVDAAVSALFQAAIAFPHEGEEQRFQDLATRCVKRLAGTPYSAACRQYCVTRLAEAEVEIPQNARTVEFWRELLAMQPANKPSSDTDHIEE